MITFIAYRIHHSPGGTDDFTRPIRMSDILDTYPTLDAALHDVKDRWSTNDDVDVGILERQGPESAELVCVMLSRGGRSPDVCLVACPELRMNIPSLSSRFPSGAGPDGRVTTISEAPGEDQ